MIAQSGLSRRRFLQGAAASGVGLTTLAFAPGRAGAADAHTVVMVALRGGLDGLSAIVPTDTGHYRDNRLLTAIPAGRLHRLDGDFGLHPALGPLVPFYRRGDLAPVVAVGSPLRSRSHFDQQAAMDLGVPGQIGHPTGWLGRHLAAVGSGGQLRGMSTGNRLAPALRGAPRSTALTSLDGFDIPAVDDADRDRIREAFLAAAGPGPFGDAARDALVITDLLVDNDAPTERASYPDNPWGRQFRDVARVVRSGLGLEVAIVDLGGWDTHAGQGSTDGQLASRLGDLAQSLAAFLTDLSDRLDRVTVVVVSEFGRRVRENGNGGTDHGRGGVAFVAGRGIRGGRVHGDWPGLASNQLDDGDVRVTTDMRDVFAEILERRSGNADIGAVFPGHEYRQIGLA